MSLETPDAVAGGLARTSRSRAGSTTWTALYDAYAAVTPQDVQAAAERYLAAERRTVGVLRAKQ